MSYLTGPAPDDLKLSTWYNNQIIVSFTCPRCGEKCEQGLKVADLLYAISVQCEHPRCIGPGELAGFTLAMYPDWQGSELGLSDRPLHKP